MALPRDILLRRIKNEIVMCRVNTRHGINLIDESISKFPIELELILDIPGPVFINGMVEHRHGHRVKLLLTPDYPYQKPIVVWRTEIFHPNIMMPEDGGHVCTKLLDEWNFSSNLLTFMKGLEHLLQNPNPSSPYNTESCVRAAKYFRDSVAERKKMQDREGRIPKVLERAEEVY